MSGKLASTHSRSLKLATVFVLICIVAVTAVLVSCGIRAPGDRFFSATIPMHGVPLGGVSDGDDTRRPLVVGGDHQYPPFEFLNDRGEPDGFNIAILERIAAIMNLDVTVELTVWSEARRRLEEGEIDMLGGMYRTAAREELHDFSIPLFIASYGLFVREDSSIRGIDDLADSLIIVHEGDLAHDYVLEEGLGAQVLAVPEWPDVLRALAEGRGDCAIFGMGQGMREIRRAGYRDLRMFETPLFRRAYSMAVGKGDAELLAVLNEGLGVLKASGEFDRIYQEWFGILETGSWWHTRQARVLIFSVAVVLLVTLIILGWVIALRRQVHRKTAQLSNALIESERIQRELEQAYETKTRFLANVSHELRTPLHGVMGMTDLLDKTGLDGDQRSLVSMIQGASGQLHRVLSDLLEVSAADAGRLSIEREPFQITRTVEWLEPTLRSRAQERGLDFRFDYRGPDTVVIGDRERIAQIVINLVGNAVKFTSHGEVGVELDYRDETLYIVVTDTGPGIAEERIEAIFEPFVQLDGNSSGFSEGGLGLGLSIVRTLVERLEGTVSVESTVGEGTTFRVTLPLAEAETPTPDTPPERPAAGGPIGAEDLVVLVAEDEAINRLYLVRLLEQAGAMVVAVDDGVRAVEAARDRRFHVILMDVSMPNMNGIEATEEIRRWEEEHGLPAQPIIALTAHAQSEHARLCAEAGMNGYVSKPYREHQIWESIAQVLQGAGSGLIRVS